VLPVIVLAQFACTSLWFAGNAVLPDMLREGRLAGLAPGAVVSAVQLGFIAGTLGVGMLGLADRVAPARLFLLCAVLGSGVNAGLLLPGIPPAAVLGLRFATGLCLAGIYPVGMKIAADYYEQGLGRALGYLVGALVLGTALPHLLRGLAAGVAWQAVVLGTSGLALAGGVLLWARVPDGPYRRVGARVQPGALGQVWRERPLRQAALGYFGHMWELYTFWAFVPLLLATYGQLHPGGRELGRAGLSRSLRWAGRPAWRGATWRGAGAAWVRRGWRWRCRARAAC
jgi:MFS family permease